MVSIIINFYISTIYISFIYPYIKGSDAVCKYRGSGEEIYSFSNQSSENYCRKTTRDKTGKTGKFYSHSHITEVILVQKL